MITNLIIKQDTVLLNINNHRSRFYNQKGDLLTVCLNVRVLCHSLDSQRAFLYGARVWDKTQNVTFQNTTFLLDVQAWALTELSSVGTYPCAQS